MSKALITEYLARVRAITDFIKSIDKEQLGLFVTSQLQLLQIGPDGIDEAIFRLSKRIVDTKADRMRGEEKGQAFIGSYPQARTGNNHHAMECAKNATYEAIHACEEQKTPLPEDLQKLRKLFHIRQIKGLLEHQQTLCTILIREGDAIRKYVHTAFATVTDDPKGPTCVEEWTNRLVNQAYTRNGLLIGTFFDPKKTQQFLSKEQLARTIPLEERAVALPIALIDQYDGLWLDNLKNAIHYTMPGCTPDTYRPLVMFDPYRACRDFSAMAAEIRENPLGENPISPGQQRKNREALDDLVALAKKSPILLEQPEPPVSVSPLGEAIPRPEIKEKNKEKSWVDRFAKQKPRQGFNVTPDGNREV